jgi:hypothetical protein
LMQSAKSFFGKKLNKSASAVVEKFIADNVRR